MALGGGNCEVRGWGYGAEDGSRAMDIAQEVELTMGSEWALGRRMRGCRGVVAYPVPRTRHKMKTTRVLNMCLGMSVTNDADAI